MMTMSTWSCPGCGASQDAGPSPYHWDLFVTTHLVCEDQAAAAERDRLDEHSDRIATNQQLWALRGLVAVFTTMLMVGMHLTGAHAYQWASAGCIVFTALIFFFEHTPGAEVDQ